MEGEALPVFCRSTGTVPFLLESSRLLPQQEGFLQAGKFVFKAFVIRTGLRNRRRGLAPRGRNIRGWLGGRGFRDGLFRDFRRPGIFHTVHRRFSRPVPAGTVLDEHVSAGQNGHALHDAEGPPCGKNLQEPAVRSVDPQSVLGIIVGVHPSFGVRPQELHPEIDTFFSGEGRKIAPPHGPFLQEVSFQIIHREYVGPVVVRLRARHDKLFPGKERHGAVGLHISGEKEISFRRENKEPRLSVRYFAGPGSDNFPRFRNGEKVRFVHPLLAEGFRIRLYLSKEFSFSGKTLDVRIHGVAFVGHVQRPVGRKGDDRRPGEGSVLTSALLPPFIHLGSGNIEKTYPFAEPVKNGNGAIGRYERSLGVTEGLLGRPEGERKALLQRGNTFPGRGEHGFDHVTVLLNRGRFPRDHHENVIALRIGFLADHKVHLHFLGLSPYLHIGGNGIEYRRAGPDGDFFFF